MSEHATREDELDDLLRREVFVDLYQVVRQSMRISHPSYSIKKVRTFFMDGAGQGAVDRRRRLDPRVRALAADRRRRRSCRRSTDYNEEDCVSTVKLRDWLLERKARSGAAIAASPFRGRPTKPSRSTDEARRGRRRLTRRSSPRAAARRSARRTCYAARGSAQLSPSRSEARVVGVLRSAEEVARRPVDDTEAIAYLTPGRGRSREGEAVARLHARLPRSGVQARPGSEDAGRRSVPAGVAPARSRGSTQPRAASV